MTDSVSTANTRQIVVIALYVQVYGRESEGELYYSASQRQFKEKSNNKKINHGRPQYRDMQRSWSLGAVCSTSLLQTPKIHDRGRICIKS